MLKLTKTGIGLLTKQYRSVLRKCLLCNLGIFTILATNNDVLALDADNYFCQDAHSTYLCNIDRIQFNTVSSYSWVNGIEIYDRNQTDKILIDIGSRGIGSRYGYLRVSGLDLAYSYLDPYGLVINNGGQATGIDFAANVTAGTTNASHLATTGTVNQLLNYYYTKTEADARYILSGNGGTEDGLAAGVRSSATGGYSLALGYEANSTGYYSSAVGFRSKANAEGSSSLGMEAVTSDLATGSVALGKGSIANESNVISVGHVVGDTNVYGDTINSDYFRRIVNVAEGSGAHDAVTVSQLGNIAAGTKILNANGESAITFGTGSGQITVGTAISNVANQLYNYYYTFRVDERAEVTDSASFFQKDFSTLQEVDLHIKNPTHLGAFAKCNEVCPRSSERFSLSLSQEQMLKNDASVDAGTSRHCLRQFGDVLADLLKNTAAKSLRIYEFMNEEVCHA